MGQLNLHQINNCKTRFTVKVIMYVCMVCYIYFFSNIKCRMNKKTSWDVNTINATASCKPTAAKGYTRAVSVMTMLKDTAL